MKVSHVNTMQVRYASNVHKIIQDTDFTENQYNNLWLDCGVVFLDEMCSTPDFELSDSYREMIFNDIRYWRWFVNEWKVIEADYISNFGHQKISTQHYALNMLQKTEKTGIKISFYEQYLPRINQYNHEEK